MCKGIRHRRMPFLLHNKEVKQGKTWQNGKYYLLLVLHFCSLSLLIPNISAKFSHFRLLIAAGMLMLPVVKTVAQDTNQAVAWTLEVKGIVTENDKKLSGAVVTVAAGGNTVNTINCSDGKFDLTLQANQDYTISFTKPGYITKRISFSTKNVPPERAKFNFTAFTIDQVDIFPEIDGSDIDQILQQPVAKILYNPKYHNGDFDFDERYTESIQALLERILAAKRALDAQYKSIITRADGNFKRQDYATAKPDYEAALKLKPNEQYPKDQLAAIEKALKDLANKQSEGAKKLAEQGAKQAKFDSLVKVGDAAFAAKDYKNARPAYTSASQMFPDKRYPKDQLRAIDNAEKNQGEDAKKAAKQAQYDSIVKIADAAFAAKKYDDAKAGYNSASGIFPDKRYPKDQLKAIDAAMRSEGDSKKQARYDSIVKVGDAAFAAKKYDDAKAAYKEASNENQKAKYPKDQLRAIDAAINAEATGAKKAELQKRYDSLVKVGDAAFAAKKYDDAKSAYTNAQTAMPKSTYPKTQLAAIDKATAPKAPDKPVTPPKKNPTAMYDSIVKKADGEFRKKDYATARTDYQAAQALKPKMPYPTQQIATIDRIKPPKKNQPKKDSVVKKPVDTVKEAPVQVQVCPCEIKKLTDSCKSKLKPFIYNGINALHIPLTLTGQEKEISLPGFSGQRYRVIINITSMPPGTVAAVYDQDNTHKKRKVLYTLSDAGTRIGFVDVDCKGGKFYVDYIIPPKDKKFPPQGCAIILFGYESR
jgi:hypothetical protein